MKHTFKKFVAVAIAAVIAFSFMTTAFAAYYGDLNGDEKVNSTDALIVLKYTVGKETEIDEKVADINSDGKVNSTDALAILRISVGQGQLEEIPEEKPSAPSSKEEIVEFYNNAVNKVIDEKTGYTKQRTTTVTELDAGKYTDMAGDIVKDFLGEGTTEIKNSKGTAKNLATATLTSSDVQSALCEKTGDTYTVTLTLKDGSSSATKSSKKDNSPIAKSGLLAGKTVSKEYDYLNSASIYAAVTAEGVKVNSVTSTNTNAKIVAVIDSDGKMLSLTASFDWAVVIEKISVTLISIPKANGKAHTAVVISDFKW